MDNGRTVLARRKLDLRSEVAYLRDQLRLSFDSAPIAQGVLRFDGRFEQVNDALCALLGYSQDELLARSMPSISHPDDMAATLDLQRRLLSGQVSSYQMDKRYIRSDKTVVWINLSVAITWTRSGEPRMLGQLVDISEAKRSEARLAHEAGHDHLTDLPNRRLVLELIDRALGDLVPGKGPTVALLFCNIDQFKDYNDSFGLLLGDRLLVTVAERLGNALHSGERLGHFGGDKLVVLIPELRATHGHFLRTEVEQALAVADRIRDAFVEPLRVGDRRSFVTLSTGIALTGDRDMSADELAGEADTAMYEARRGGRNQVRLFDAALRNVVRNRWEIESELRTALDNGDVTAWFQPVVDLADGTIHGFEALAHWVHPERGVIPPDAFIAIAERAGLISRLGDVMLDDALRMARRCDVGHIAMNVSPTELSDRGLVTRVAEALRRNGVDPLRLVIEVTEQAVIEDFDLAALILEGLRELGVRVFIDDFGVGHSSLAQLTRLPIDGLKIDRSFVQDLDVRRLVLIELVVDLARRLDFEVVAEGVETREHVETLLSTGCRLAQGFRFAPALAPEAALRAATLGHIERHARFAAATLSAPTARVDAGQPTSGERHC
jgi:diguanylate cyclase (GGDEF)-like protein/PAS domain S-box-containing protein